MSTKSPGKAIVAAGTAQISIRPKSPTDAPARSSRRSSKAIDRNRASGSPLPAPVEPPEDGAAGAPPAPPPERAGGDPSADGDAVGSPSPDWPGPAVADDVGDAVAPGEPLGDGVAGALFPACGSEGSGEVGEDSDGSGSEGSGNDTDGVGSGRIGVGVGLGVAVGAGVGIGVGTGVGVIAGPLMKTIGGTPSKAPVPPQPWSR
jgi:hypothetical protein